MSEVFYLALQSVTRTVTEHDLVRLADVINLLSEENLLRLIPHLSDETRNILFCAV